MTSYTTTAGYNALTGVSANSLNTVFFSVANDGVFALPNSSSGPNPAGIYKVSGQGGQGLAVDSIGNLYTVGYLNSLSHTGVAKTILNNFSFGASPVGTAATAATVSINDNAGNCTTPPTLAFSSLEGGVASTEFANRGWNVLFNIRRHRQWNLQSCACVHRRFILGNRYLHANCSRLAQSCAGCYRFGKLRQRHHSAHRRWSGRRSQRRPRRLDRIRNRIHQTLFSLCGCRG